MAREQVSKSEQIMPNIEEYVTQLLKFPTHIL